MRLAGQRPIFWPSVWYEGRGLKSPPLYVDRTPVMPDSNRELVLTVSDVPIRLASMFSPPVPHRRAFLATDPSERGFRATVMVRRGI
jgi:hypothetical protein